MASRENVVQRINTELEEDWEAKLNQEGRIYYISHKAQTTSWLPPRENWTDTSGLPYGWETGVDRNDKDYFINHVERYTTRDDPRHDPDYVEPPRPRQVELQRDLEKGFGFVAGSEKPVVVRYVTEGGPSEEKLLPGDQILKINGEEVRRAPREKVIDLVRSCRQTITLTVCQPYTDNSSRKSALLTAAKKAKLKSNPSRVRFADAVLVNGASITNPSPVESYVPFMPNVLKVFLENGQTKSFKYDNKTTVKDVMQSLQEKLNIRTVHHFNLVLQNMKSNTGTAAKMTLLQEHETLAEIAARQGARYFRCLFRVTFVPKDAYDLLKEDPIAFEYFYVQCCNDVLHERFASEMKYDTALRLAALHIQQHAMSNNLAAKVSIKAVLKECGLEKFVSKGLLETMKGKELKRMLSQYLKMNQSLAAPGQKQLSAMQAKLHYMKIVGELKTFGSRVFMVTLLDKKTEAMLLVGPHSGISIVTNIKSYALTQLADFAQLEQVKVTKDGDNMQRVDLRLKAHVTEAISLGLLSEDAHNFVCLVAGYYRIFVDSDRRLVERTLGKNTTDPDVPSYESVHRVLQSPWAYPEDLVSEVVVGHTGPAENGVLGSHRQVNLGQDPPEYEPNEEYLARIKQDLGLQNTSIMTSYPHRPQNVTILPMTHLTNGGQKGSNSSSPFDEGVTSFGTSSGDPSFASLGASQLATSSSSSAVYGLSGRAALLNTTIDLRRSQPAANGHGSPPHQGLAAVFLDSQVESERSSDTDSLSTVDAERRPLLGETVVTLNGDLRHSAGGTGGVGGGVGGGAEIESDDTDSFGTPSGSPAKTRHMQRVSSVESGMHSFGLHSPDMLPAADVDFRNLSEVDVSQLPPEVYQAIYRPDGNMIPPRKIYFDPDIIDLTIFPLPDTGAEDDSVIDFTALPSVPPPSFANPHPSSSSPSPRQTGRQTPNGSDFSYGYQGRTGSGQPGLVRSASADHCPDFFDSDIDSLIAQYYVPPPPSSHDSDSSHSQALSQSFSGAISTSTHYYLPDSSSRETDFSSLIIPPPPASSASQAEEAAPVSPVSTDAKDRRRRFRHKRSSSVDIGSLNMAKQQLEETQKRRSLDGQDSRQREESSIPRSSLPRDLKGVEDMDSDSHDGLTAESPATVSLKLHNLLKSLPNFAPEAAMETQHQQAPFFRTGSLRIHRSASWDTVPGGSSAMQNGSAADVAQAFAGKATQRTFFSGTVSLGRNSGRRAKSFEQLNATGIKDKAGNNSNGSPSESTQQQSPSESFASLKAKLKDYRDHLLRRSGHSRKNSEDMNMESEEKKKGSLRRSNSFSRLLAQFSGRRAIKERVLVADGGNWTLKQRWEGESSSTGDLRTCGSSPAGDEEKRGTPTVRETFAVPRTSLRPVSTSGADQNKSKKSGPLKALSSVFASDEKSADNGHASPSDRKGAASNTTSPSRSKAHSTTLGSSKKGGPKYSSKDDLSVTPEGGKKKKKDKMKVNPYATTTMWRPITMTSSVSHKNEEVYRSFTNFDVLVSDAARLPATGDLRNDDFPSTAILSRTISNPVTAHEFESSVFGENVPPDYRPQPSPDISVRSSRHSDAGQNSQPMKTRLAPRRSAPPAPVAASLETSGHRAPYMPSSSSAVTVPLRSRSLPFEEQMDDAGNTVPPPPPRRSRHVSRSSSASLGASSMNGSADIPEDYPVDSSSSTSSQRSRSLSYDSGGRRDSSERRGRSIMDSSTDVVSLDVSKMVRSVISKTYGPEGFDQATQDVEAMLTGLKATMETLKTSQASVSGSSSQFQTVKQELQLQTKQFVQDAKGLVAGANGPRPTVSHHLHSAMHTLARILLHSQATMVRMRSVHQAQHTGFEVLKVAASFKSTVAAANAALGKPTTDPHMKYLMRQAANLAGLLSTLLKTLKALEQT